MSEDNFRPKNPDNPGSIGDTKGMGKSRAAQNPGYDVSKSIPGCDKGCLEPDAGYQPMGKIPRSQVGSDKGFA